LDRQICHVKITAMGYGRRLYTVHASKNSRHLLTAQSLLTQGTTNLRKILICGLRPGREQKSYSKRLVSPLTSEQHSGDSLVEFRSRPSCATRYSEHLTLTARRCLSYLPALLQTSHSKRTQVFWDVTSGSRRF
jgi:hypothetical protein